MRKESALGELEIVCKDADGEAGQADLTGESGGVLENGCLGTFALAHAEKIARTFVLSMPLCKSSRNNAFRAVLAADPVDGAGEAAVAVRFNRSPSPEQGEGVRG
jgi:hypothetical protein